MEAQLPLGRDEWEFVLAIHNQHFRANNRAVDSLRRKFAALCRTRIPTGNPTCPPEVATAMRVRFLMTQRADIGERDIITEEDIGISRETHGHDTDAAQVSVQATPSPPDNSLVLADQESPATSEFPKPKLSPVQLLAPAPVSPACL
ncbi:unnamed protein product [Phytophthora fragariaefolia]|uniref:Unnamed protein product n=1 Tax=Phytophthora fragariaefolia TaxID=1490495 RepID=A0A9W6WZJ9_9STRA|nr:unnamed protein product [Phytophthora fragariaefolia]